MTTHKFRLSIYTHKPLTGAPAGLVVSEHNSAEEAASALAAHASPYSYAHLSVWDDFGTSWVPADFDGRRSHTPEFRLGENWGKDHPALSALNADWDSLAADVAREHTDKGIPLVHGAAEILSQRHPQICGMAERLAEAAYAKLTVAKQQ